MAPVRNPDVKMGRNCVVVADWVQPLEDAPPMKCIRLLALAGTLVLAAVTARPAGRDIYPDPARARADIAAALKTAAQTHKRVLLDFGGNWCGDCLVLDMFFHDPTNRPILEANFVLVHVNVGQLDENVEIARRYQIPLQRGVPALAVLTETGKMLFSQKSGQFEKMSRVESRDVTAFLMQWKPVKPGCSVVLVTC